MQLFDEDNHVNVETARYIFSTEGHLFPVNSELRKRTWEDDASPVSSKTKENERHQKRPKSHESNQENFLINARLDNTSNEKVPLFSVRITLPYIWMA